jgi:hypothetical protein
LWRRPRNQQQQMECDGGREKSWKGITEVGHYRIIPASRRLSNLAIAIVRVRGVVSRIGEFTCLV